VVRPGVSEEVVLVEKEGRVVVAFEVIGMMRAAAEWGCDAWSEAEEEECGEE